MRTIVAVFLCTLLGPACCLSAASGGGQTKDFPEYRCRLTLPGSGYRWLDHTQIPHCVAFLADASGTIRLTLLVEPNPEGASINEMFVKGFDKGFSEDGRGSKIAGRITAFRGVPCYEMHARITGISGPVTIRAFAANGRLFQLQLFGSNLPVRERSKLEPVFSAFEFVGEPELPVLSPGLENKGLARTLFKYKLVAGGVVVVIAVFILVVRDASRRRKNKSSR